MHLQLLSTTPAVSVFYDADNEWLYLDWQGDLTLESVQAGCLVVAQCFLHRNYQRVLNDNSGVTSLSPEVASWLATRFLPYLQLTAIEYIAWTYSPNMDTQSWTNSAVYQVDGPVVAMFDDLESAYAWLREVKFRVPGLAAAVKLSETEAHQMLRDRVEAVFTRGKQAERQLSTALQ